jgi:D-arabinose 1-dehydrogenase-like Zn-dependent alcohol dehydrogenase
VVVYNSIFDGTCDMCLSGSEMLCRNTGILGVITNGGFADYISAPETNVLNYRIMHNGMYQQVSLQLLKHHIMH